MKELQRQKNKPKILIHINILNGVKLIYFLIISFLS